VFSFGSQVAHYGLGAVTSPRQTVRNLLQKEKLLPFAWGVVFFEAALSFVLSVVEESALADRFPDDADIVYESEIYFTVLLAVCSIGFFPLVVFLWQKLFRFAKYRKELIAAYVLSLLVGLISYLPSIFVSVFAAKSIVSFFQSYQIWFLLAVLIGYTPIFYQETLRISWQRAIATNLVIVGGILAVFLGVFVAIDVALGGKYVQ